MTWRMDDPQGNEAGKIRYLIVPFTRGRGLDLGCGPSKAWPHFIGVDNYKDTGLFGVRMKPDIPAECDKLTLFTDESMDFVFSSHLLEHIEDYKAALAEWWRVVKPGGFLVLYLPDRDLYPNIGQEGANPDHKHDFTRSDITDAMAAIATGGFTLMMNEQRGEGVEYSFLQVFEKRADGRFMDSTATFKPSDERKTACVVRYGGCGDMMQAAGTCAQLQKAGFRVTLMTTPRGAELCRNNPSIDAYLVQDKDQVPNVELPAFWKAWAGRFNRFVNLSESVEGSLLAMPGRANHSWPEALRRRMMGGVNYNEFMADLAGVKFEILGPLFYPTDDEIAHTKTLMLPGTFNIVMALAGSSLHKVWPHMDTFIARVMLKIPGAVVHLVGDAACKILEQGWENEPRVRRHSGELSERISITLAKLSNMVVGPETGIPNAVAFDRVPKAVMLSHSSARNLTHHWVNCTAVEPEREVSCYPCHRLHYTWEFCTEVEEAASAWCATRTDPKHVFEATQRAWKSWKAKGERKAA